MSTPWADRGYLRGTQYRTDANLAARQSVYSYQRPRIDLAAQVLDLAAPAPGDTVLDVGCGNGLYLDELARRGTRGRVLGADLSVGMLTAARSRLSAAARPAVALAAADAAVLPLRDDAVGFALAAHMLYHVPEPLAAVRELARVTRPGGRVVIVLNGAGHLSELRAAIATVTAQDQAALGERVSLDQGEAIARSVFAQVTRHDFTAELQIPSREPLVGYIASMVGTPRGDAAGQAEAVLAAIPRTLEGHYAIGTHVGCLVCVVAGPRRLPAAGAATAAAVTGGAAPLPASVARRGRRPAG